MWDSSVMASPNGTWALPGRMGSPSTGWGRGPCLAGPSSSMGRSGSNRTKRRKSENGSCSSRNKGGFPPFGRGPPLDLLPLAICYPWQSAKGRTNVLTVGPGSLRVCFSGARPFRRGLVRGGLWLPPWGPLRSASLRSGLRPWRASAVAPPALRFAPGPLPAWSRAGQAVAWWVAGRLWGMPSGLAAWVGGSLWPRPCGPGL